MLQHFSTIKRWKIQHNLWKLIYKYVDIHSFLCILYVSKSSYQERKASWFSLLWAPKLLVDFCPHSILSFQPSLFLSLRDPALSYLCIATTLRKTQTMEFYDEKEKKLWGVALWLKLVKWQPHCFSPLPFSNSCIVVSFFQKTRKKRTVNNHWDSVFLLNWRGKKKHI